MNADGQVVIRGQQTGALGDDAVTVVVGIGGDGDVEFILEADEPLHGVRRRGIHADSAVPVDGHESECGIDRFIDDGQIQAVPFGDHRPIINTRAAERVDTERNLCVADRFQVDDAFEIVDIRVQVVVPVGRGAAQRL